ncbi:hypothetical protein HDE_14073 [Halotydeus destructor]|nr:hypothetical protein HDE_14073 [Halotydeus destructor]
MGLAYQVYQILDVYLAYRTVTVVVTRLSTREEPLDLSVCLRYSHIFDHIRFKSENPMTTLGITFRDMHERLTVREIFNYTTPTSQVLTNCAIRYPREYKITRISNEKCVDEIQVTKFLTQGFMCYHSTVKLDYNTSHSYSYAQVTRALEFMGTLFAVDLNITAGMMKLVLHSWNSKPLYSMMYSPYLTLKQDGRQVIAEQFGLTGSVIRITSLPPPYDTRCRDYTPEYRSQTDCEFLCVRNKTLQQLDKTSYEIFEIDALLDKKHISMSDIENETITEVLSNISDACNARCNQIDCLNQFTLTRVVKSPLSKSKLNRIFVDMSCEPNLQITFKAVMGTLDLVIYILSSAGTWLGISVFSFDPARWLFPIWVSWKNKRIVVTPGGPLYTETISIKELRLR